MGEGEKRQARDGGEWGGKGGGGAIPGPPRPTCLHTLLIIQATKITPYIR